MNPFQNFFGSSQTAINLKELVDDGALLVDVRQPEEFAAGTANGAINIPLGVLPAQLSRFEGKKHIIVFCRSGNRSETARLILESKGIGNVVNGGSLDDVVRQLG